MINESLLGQFQIPMGEAPQRQDEDTNATEIQSLSGVEFENLCLRLLQKMDFSVSTTSISGDGGIDLIAISDKPMFKGKYIIQCKRYKDTVGVAFVRDLYGVVTDEKANKGILITTGHFSSSAINFAEDKNIELIDGDELLSLLNEYGLDSSRAEEEKSFLNYACFDRNKFDFYKGMIAQNQCTKVMGRDFILKFLFGYLSDYQINDDTLAIIHNGLASEYKKLYNWYVAKYFQKGKEELALLPYYNRKYLGIAQLYTFDLFDFFQYRYNILRRDYWYRIETSLVTGSMRTYSIKDIPDEKLAIIGARCALKKWDEVKYVCGVDFYEVLSLFSLCQYFNIEKGEQYICRKLRSVTTNFSTRLIMGNLPEYETALKKVAIFIPEFKTWNDGKNYRVQAQYTFSTNLKSYFEKYRFEHEDKIRTEIERISSLFDALDS